MGLTRSTARRALDNAPAARTAEASGMDLLQGAAS